MRRHISSKSDTYPESSSVDAAGISVKVGAHYPGRSGRLPSWLPPSQGGGMDEQKLAEAIVAPSTWREGPNPEERQASRSLIGTDDGRRGVKPADTEDRDGIPKAGVCAEEPMAGAEAASLETTKLMERLVERENMLKAYGRVVGNKGAAGVDGMSVADLKGWLRIHWPEVKEALLAGRYQPMAVRGVEIPKANGGKRQLGIPTVVDRLIQQALHQVLNPLFDPGFSPSSYGFRNGRSAHQAVLAAREFQRQGRRWVVDLDLTKFFDEVNHDLLMSRIAVKVEDKRLLHLIRRYLQAGILVNGVVMEREKGTP